MKLAFLSALIASVAMAQRCGVNQYYSHNTKSCKAAGKAGNYCNVVQLCESGNDCVSNVCTASTFIFEMNPTLAAYGEACTTNANCVPGANVCRNNMCSAPTFGAAGDSGLGAWPGVRAGVAWCSAGCGLCTACVVTVRR